MPRAFLYFLCSSMFFALLICSLYIFPIASFCHSYSYFCLTFFSSFLFVLFLRLLFVSFSLPLFSNSSHLSLLLCFVIYPLSLFQCIWFIISSLSVSVFYFFLSLIISSPLLFVSLISFVSFFIYFFYLDLFFSRTSCTRFTLSSLRVTGPCSRKATDKENEWQN